MYIAIKLVSGVERGVEIRYSLDGEVRYVTIASRAEAKLVKGVDGYERSAEVVIQGILKPPKSGTYVFLIETGNGRGRLVVESRELSLRSDGGILVSTPIHLLDTGFYRYRLEHVSRAPITKVRMFWLREDGVIEPIGRDNSYVQRSTSIVVQGLRDGCRAMLTSIGVVSEALVRNGVAEFSLGDLKPPIDVCLELMCGSTREKVVCLSGAWGGDVYRIDTVENLRRYGLR